MTKKSMAMQDKKWELDNAVNTLQRAQEIQQNKPLMKQVQKHAMQTAANLQKAVMPMAAKMPTKKK